MADEHFSPRFAPDPDPPDTMIRIFKFILGFALGLFFLAIIMACDSVPADTEPPTGNDAEVSVSGSYVRELSIGGVSQQMVMTFFDDGYSLFQSDDFLVVGVWFMDHRGMLSLADGGCIDNATGGLLIGRYNVSHTSAKLVIQFQQTDMSAPICGREAALSGEWLPYSDGPKVISRPTKNILRSASHKSDFWHGY